MIQLDSNFLAVVAVLLVSCNSMPSSALELPAPEPEQAAAQTPPVAPSGSNTSPAADSNIPDSTEPGQVDLSQSFDRRPLQEWLHESQLVGLRDTTISIKLRSYYRDFETFDNSESEAWTLGGSAGFKTGYFWDFIALGATGFTSQRLFGPADKDGTGLLRPGQQSYSVLGELYGKFRLTDKITATAGRSQIDTPFINTQDTLMTPNTFEAYAVQGVIGSTDSQTLHFGGGFVDKIKPRNSEDFISMAQAAGAPRGVDRGVYVAGANYQTGQLSAGAIEYYCADIINIVYTELKYAMPLSNSLALRFAAQYTNQRSVGDNLLTAKFFSADQISLKAELVVGTALFTVAHSITANGTSNGTGGGTNMRNPWSGYPGFTAGQIESFNRAGEDATMLRAAYNFPKATGLSVYGLWISGSRPDLEQQYAEQEYNLNVQWTAQRGALQGTSFLARYSHTTEFGPTDQHRDDFRMILNYTLR